MEHKSVVLRLNILQNKVCTNEVTFGFRGEVLDVARGNLLPREALHV
jgi:hypothetical protein